MLDLHSAMPTCLKCNHTRTAADPGPDYACPKCGAVYAKLEAAAQAKRIATVDASDRKRHPFNQEAREKEYTGANLEQEGTHCMLAHVGYALMIVPIGSILLTLLLAYIVKSAAAGSWLESHFRWQIWTVWGLVLWGIGLIVAGMGGLDLAVVGLVLMMLAWFFYRLAKGWYFLVKGEQVT